MTAPDQATLTVDTQQDGSLLLRASGNWSVHTTVPTLPDLSPQLKKTPGDTRLQFDLSHLGSWDSSLVSVILSLLKNCQSQGIKPETDSLPEGLQRLVTLAVAVPERNTPRSPERELFFTRIGKAGLSLGAGIMEVFTFMGIITTALGRLLRGRAVFRWSDTWLIIQRCGSEALPIVTLINFLIGIILGFVGAVELQKFGASIYMADLVGIAMVRELGCIMTGIIMSGRTGAAFAAEIGSMKVNQEIDALKTLGFSPVDFLVLPRMLALVLMLPLLTIYGNVMGMLGGAILAPAFDVSYRQYYDQLINAVDLANYSAGVLKSFAFGAVIATAGCLKGIQSGNSASAVGAATTSAVVTSITTIIALDAIFAFTLTSLGL